ncbi:MAG TPA: TadE/TadG family type IV pilus assembly protein [Sphingomicrobium sp.]|nr:TadE/TadG family type IV pilus assembly protein [Sphingomicrobium sp.]
MTRFIHIRRDERGAAVIEIAIALPTLILFIWGIFQLGIAFQASAGMQHALGEGARLATICVNPTAAGCSTPTDAAILAKVNDKLFGTGIGEFDAEITRPVDDPDTPTVDESDVNYIDLNATFSMPTNFLFFNGPNINLSRTKRVYLAG